MTLAPAHNPLPRGHRLDGIGHEGTLHERPVRGSTAPPGLWAPAPEVVKAKAVKAKKPKAKRVRAVRPRSTAPRANKAECGTDSGYKKHTREKTPVCDPCRLAHNERNRRYSAADGRSRKQYVRAECGTQQGYDGHRSRKERVCDECRLAHNGHQRARRRSAATAEGRAVQPRAAVAVCGTASGFKKHWRSKEEPCGPCRAAKNAEDQAYRASRRNQAGGVSADAA